jgi:hypothetical protein
MKPLTSGEAAEILSEHHEGIRDALKNGWLRWRNMVKQDTELAVIVSNRTRAGLVYDFIRYEASSLFDDVSGVTVSESRGFLHLTFDERIVLRFKKFRGKGLKTSSVPTQQARSFEMQTLPGMEELTHLVAGYLPDEAGIDLDKVAITCSLDQELLWVIDLDLGFDDGLDLDEGLDPAGPAPLVPTGGLGDTQVVPKRDQAKDGRE